MYDYDYDFLVKVAEEAGDPTEMYNRHARNAGYLTAGNLATSFFPVPGAGLISGGMGIGSKIENWKAYNQMANADIDMSDPKQYHRAKRVRDAQHSLYSGLGGALVGGAGLGLMGTGNKAAQAVGKGLVALGGAGMVGSAGLNLASLYHGAREAMA